MTLQYSIAHPQSHDRRSSLKLPQLKALKDTRFIYKEKEKGFSKEGENYYNKDSLFFLLEILT